MTPIAKRKAGSRDGRRRSQALFPKLPPGPGRSPERVAGHQLERIHGAVIEIVCQRGYKALKIHEIVKLAGVSRRTFYEHFEDKHDCFLATYDMLGSRAEQRFTDAQQDAGERERLRQAFAGLLELAASEPKAARVALLDAYGAGPAVRERMRGLSERFQELVALSLDCEQEGEQVPALLCTAIVAGLTQVLRARLLAGRADELPALAAPLAEWATTIACPQAAVLEDLEVPAPAAPPSKPPLSSLYAREARDNRARALAAIVTLAAEHGYWHLTAARVRTAAHVSRPSFDAHFEDVHDCFAAALTRMLSRGLARAERASARGHGWAGGLHHAVSELCTLTAADPVFAKLAFVEVFATGADGLRLRGELIAAAINKLRAAAPQASRPSQLAAEASTGAIWEIIQHHVADGHAERLPQLAPLLSFIALAPTDGADATIAAIAVEQRQRLDAVGSAGQARPETALRIVTPAR